MEVIANILRRIWGLISILIGIFVAANIGFDLENKSAFWVGILIGLVIYFIGLVALRKITNRS